ncbi:MAG: hypothetical protein V4568_06595 [Pseudomonadota bacterium]
MSNEIETVMATLALAITFNRFSEGGRCDVYIGKRERETDGSLKNWAARNIGLWVISLMQWR